MNRKTDVWALQDAKARLSELVQRAMTSGRPQRITRHGEDAVVVISAAAFDTLTRKPNDTIVEFLRKSPLAEFSETDWKNILDRRLDSERRVELE